MGGFTVRFCRQHMISQVSCSALKLTAVVLQLPQLTCHSVAQTAAAEDQPVECTLADNAPLVDADAGGVHELAMSGHNSATHTAAYLGQPLTYLATDLEHKLAIVTLTL
jgi:hypothetical protein